MEWLAYILTALSAYLLGSIPTGFLVGKARGIDLRKQGSGNIGATNAFRILGKPAGTLVLVVDAVKGSAACWLAAQVIYANWGGGGMGAEEREYLAVEAALFVILGHIYTCWLGFKGGKGVATTGGVMLALSPMGLLITLSVWLLVCGVTRFVSVASIVAGVSLPVAVWLSGGSVLMIATFGIIGALAIFKHRTNIKRLIQGTESRIGHRKETEAK